MMLTHTVLTDLPPDLSRRHFLRTRPGERRLHD